MIYHTVEQAIQDCVDNVGLQYHNAQLVKFNGASANSSGKFNAGEVTHLYIYFNYVNKDGIPSKLYTESDNLGPWASLTSEPGQVPLEKLEWPVPIPVKEAHNRMIELDYKVPYTTFDLRQMPERPEFAEPVYWFSTDSITALVGSTDGKFAIQMVEK